MIKGGKRGFHFSIIQEVIFWHPVATCVEMILKQSTKYIQH